MSDSWRQAATFRERAAECLRLSEIDLNLEIQVGYRRLAEAYLTMANNELSHTEPCRQLPSQFCQHELCYATVPIRTRPPAKWRIALTSAAATLDEPRPRRTPERSGYLVSSNAYAGDASESARRPRT